MRPDILPPPDASMLQSGRIVPLAILICTYAFISIRRFPWVPLNRPAAAMAGAMLMVLFGGLTLDDAYRLVHWNTISLLLGMMLLVAYLRVSGFFGLVAGTLTSHVRRADVLLAGMVVASGLLSAVAVNDAVCLMFTPVVLAVTARAGLNPVPFLLAVAMGSNIGSALTYTGNPQNMFIGMEVSRLHPEWTWLRFLLLMLPIVVPSLLVCAFCIVLLHRGDLAGRRLDPAPATVETLRPRLLALSIAGLAGTLVAFAVWPERMPLIALAGGTAVMVFSREDPAPFLVREVDWSLLLFFSALFVIVGGVERSGLLDDVRVRVLPWFKDGAAGEVGVFSAFSLVMSNLFSNVPFVVAAGSWVEGFSRPDLGWVTLAMSSTLAGNLTIVGSVANLIVLEQARKHASVGLWDYCRVGIPVTLATTGFGVAVLWAAHAWGFGW